MNNIVLFYGVDEIDESNGLDLLIKENIPDCEMMDKIHKLSIVLIMYLLENNNIYYKYANNIHNNRVISKQIYLSKTYCNNRYCSWY